MECTYTGARVYFDEYGCTVPADLFTDNKVVVIQWEPKGEVFDNGASATHTVHIHHGYHHKGRGITVVPIDNVQGSLYR